MKLRKFNDWLLESAQDRLQQLGLLSKKSPAEWAQWFIRAAHPEWSVTKGSITPLGEIKARFFVVFGEPDETAGSNSFDYDWVEVRVYGEQLMLRFWCREEDNERELILDLPGPPATSLEVGRFIAARFEDFLGELDPSVTESYSRLAKLGLAPSGTFFELLKTLVEKYHPDWELITHNIGRQLYIIPAWLVPVQVVFEVAHSNCGDEADPDQHLTEIQPIDELHRLKLKRIELVSELGEYSPWTEAKRTLAKIEEWVRVTTEKQLASNK